MIAHIFSRLEPGGAEIRTLDMIERMSGSATFVFLLTGRPGGSLEERARGLGCQIVYVGSGVEFVQNLRRAVRRHGVTVLHAHSATASGWFVLNGWVLGVPRRIAHFRSDGDGRSSNPRRILQRWLLRGLIRVFATDIVAVSPSALTFATSGLPGRPGQVVPSGLSVRPLLPAEERLALRGDLVGSDQVCVIHIGRDRPEKNRPRAVRVLAATRRSGVDAKLVIVGRLGQDEAMDLEAMAAGEGVLDHVLLLGERGDVQELLSVADVCLVTSLREGLPGSVLEACAMGTPCLASALPGVRWVAQTFASVHLAELEWADEVWAELIREMSNHKVTDDERAASRARFETSAFGMATAEREYAKLWGVDAV
ncbi:glycosyltransferase [Nocardioides sp. AE5]|uniref:glycosyltransferase n=1 Tax=Nocardioides sp. AE5 TaxID=2962573 RepID=UPI0028824FF1|nr:glycosyltransferase [Nocardioides sp. AE5]MDT0202638.1 glycosyltransferase [Nocardioides sp. AE5]